MEDEEFFPEDFEEALDDAQCFSDEFMMYVAPDARIQVHGDTAFLCIPTRPAH